MNEFIYFFKHKNDLAVKIGKTSGDSVVSRFNQFKTYCPHGAEIVGFFKTKNAFIVEKELHQLFSSERLSGEWFDISEEVVQNVIARYDNSYLKAKTLFNEWIASPDNNIEKLCSILKSANQFAAVPDADNKAILSVVTEGNGFYSSKEILSRILISNPSFNLTAFKTAFKLNKLGFKYISKRIGNKIKKGYVLDLI